MKVYSINVFECEIFRQNLHKAYKEVVFKKGLTLSVIN